MIREMNIKDSSQCAELHYDSINNSFLCEFGLFFLKKLYEGLIESEHCAGYVYTSGDDVLGLIIGSEKMDDFLKKLMLRKSYVFVPIVLLKLITKPWIIRNVIETFFYSSKSDTGNVEAELVSIVVREDCREKGIGGKLFNELITFFREKKVFEFKVMVDKSNENANEFYKALGFKWAFVFRMYGKEINLYTYNIK